jgi:hypothetical protein
MASLQTFIKSALNAMPIETALETPKWPAFVQDVFTQHFEGREIYLDPIECAQVIKSKILDVGAFKNSLNSNSTGCSKWDYEPANIYYFQKLERKFSGCSHENSMFDSRPLYTLDEATGRRMLSSDYITYTFENDDSVHISDIFHL